ncbi:MAG: hypothetical protein ABI597_10555 [Gammaproteobacteria bacterium]
MWHRKVYSLLSGAPHEHKSAAVPLEDQSTSQPIKAPVVETKASPKEKELSDDFVRLESEDLPSEEELKLSVQQKMDSCGYYSARVALKMMTLLFGTAVDVFQFSAALKDIDGKMLGLIPMTNPVSWVLVCIYAAQSINVNKKFAFEGIDTFFRAKLGEKPEDWEELPEGDTRKANVCSAVLITYVILSDAISTTYYLEQNGFGLSRSAHFLISILTSLSNLPTEGLETHSFIRSKFSKIPKVIKNALTQIHKSETYIALLQKQKKNFDAAWEELSSHLLIALIKPANKSLASNSDELSKKILSILEKDAAPMADAFVALQIEPDVADELAKKFTQAMNPDAEQKEEPEEDQKGLLQSLKTAIDWALKNLLKLFGATQDTTESYTTVAAMATIMLSTTSPYLRVPLYILSVLNGLVDTLFNGKNTSEAIDSGKEGIKNGVSLRKIIVFALSFFTAGMVGHAQFSLILAMLNDPDAELPPPLPEQFPDGVNLAQSIGAGLRELILYTFYLYPIFDFGADAVSYGASKALSLFTPQGQSATPFPESSLEVEGDAEHDAFTNIVDETPKKTTANEDPDDWQLIEKEANDATSAQSPLLANNLFVAAKSSSSPTNTPSTKSSLSPT